MSPQGPPEQEERPDPQACPPLRPGQAAQEEDLQLPAQLGLDLSLLTRVPPLGGGQEESTAEQAQLDH